MVCRVSDDHHPTNAPETESVAILVHGTYAGDEESTGEKWWQSGSRAANLLRSKLPSGVGLIRDSEVFHWSGENSERARSQAAKKLLRHLEHQEERGIGYHLVGHSHGGSVIWSALRLATLSKKPLSGLRSWTTVGTPYLQHHGRSAWSGGNLAGIILGLLLLRPGFNALRALTSMLANAMAGERVALILPPDDQVGYVAVLRAPILAGIERLGVTVRQSEEHVQLGQYDPFSGMSLAHYFFATTEGLLLLGTVILTAYVFLHLSMLCARPPLESYRIRAEQHLQQRTYKDFGSRWLGIWSPDDEAINGLRATLDISMSFIGKMMPRERVFFTDAINLLSRPYYWLFAPLLNRAVIPAVDAKVKNVVIRAAQGNDRPASTVIAVTPWPVAECQNSCPPLPENVNRKLLSYADQNAQDIAPKLRRLLANPSFTTGIAAFGKELSGNELVHTSYFEHAEVLDLIACNIAWATGRDALEARASRLDPHLAAWFAESKFRNLDRPPTISIREKSPAVVPRRKPDHLTASNRPTGSESAGNASVGKMAA